MLRIASVGITLLGMAYLIWDNISGAGNVSFSQLSSEASRVKK